MNFRMKYKIIFFIIGLFILLKSGNTQISAKYTTIEWETPFLFKDGSLYKLIITARSNTGGVAGGVSVNLNLNKGTVISAPPPTDSSGKTFALVKFTSTGDLETVIEAPAGSGAYTTNNIFYDDFTDGNPYDNHPVFWHVVSGAWGASTGKLQGTNAGLIVSGSNTWQNYRVSFKMQTLSAGSVEWQVGRFVFRYKDSHNYYALLLFKDNGRLEIGAMYEGTWHGGVLYTSTPYKGTNENQFTVEVTGSGPVNVKVYVNGVLYINKAINNWIIPYGKIGATIADSGVIMSIDDVQVSQIIEVDDTFRDDFSSYTNYSDGSPYWSGLQNGFYVLNRSFTGSNDIAVTGKTDWKKYGIKSDVKVQDSYSNNYYVGLVFRYVSPTNYYIFYLNGNQECGIKKKEGSSEIELYKNDSDFIPERVNTMEVIVSNINATNIFISPYINGVKITSLTDSSLILTNGKAGLIAKNCRGNFDNVIISFEPGEAVEEEIEEVDEEIKVAAEGRYSGIKKEEKGVYVLNGCYTNIEIGGERCITPLNNSLYFNVKDDYISKGNTSDVFISIKYFDTGTGDVYLEYDGMEGTTVATQTIITLGNTGRWKYYTFYIPDPMFTNSLLGDTDFRIYSTDGRIYISEIYVHKAPGQWIGTNLSNMPVEESFSSKDVVIMCFFDYGYNSRLGINWIEWNNIYNDRWAEHPYSYNPLSGYNYDFGYQSVDWWKEEINSIIDAGIDVILLRYNGDYFSLRDAGFDALRNLVTALYELKEEGKRIPKIGLGYSASSLDNDGNGIIGFYREYGYNLSGKPDVLILYKHIRDFYSQIPPEFWALIDNKPVVVFDGKPGTVGEAYSCDGFQEVSTLFASRFKTKSGGKQLYYFFNLADGWQIHSIDYNAIGYNYDYGYSLLDANFKNSVVHKDIYHYYWKLKEMDAFGISPGYDNRLDDPLTPVYYPKMNGEHFRLSLVDNEGNTLSTNGGWKYLLKLLNQQLQLGKKATVIIKSWNNYKYGQTLCKTVEYGEKLIKDMYFYSSMAHQGLYKMSDDDSVSSSDFVVQYRVLSYDTNVIAGNNIKAKIKLINKGNAGWLNYSYNGKGVVSLRLKSPYTNIYRLPYPVAPGDSCILNISIPSFKHSTNVNLEFDMFVKDMGSQWFSQINPSQNSVLSLPVKVTNLSLSSPTVLLVSNSSTSISLFITNNYSSDNKYLILCKGNGIKGFSSLYKDYKDFVYDGIWREGTNSLTGENSYYSGFFINYKFSDFYFSFDFKPVFLPDSDKTYIAIPFLEEDFFNKYQVNVYYNRIVLLKITNGITKTNEIYNNWLYDYPSLRIFNSFKNIKISKKDERIRIYLNNNLIIEESVPEGVKGGFGFAPVAEYNAENDIKVDFRNITIGPDEDDYFIVDIITNNRFIHTDLLPSTSYSYKIYTLGAGNSIISSPAILNVNTHTSLNFKPYCRYSDKGITVSWNPGIDDMVIRYEVYRSENNGTYKYISSVSPSSKIYIDHSIQDGKAYRYKIKVIESDFTGFSLESDQILSFLSSTVDINKNLIRSGESVAINLTLSEPQVINIAVYTLGGKKIKEIVSNKYYSSGKHTFYWNGNQINNKELRSGVYLIRIKGKSIKKTFKIVYVK